MNEKLERWLGTLFGLIFIALSFVVTIETLMRKLFNASLQGADELGGYALAFGATLAFAVALLGRSHIRVDVFHEKLPRLLRTLLNWLSAVSLAAFALLLAWLAWYVLKDSQDYQSVAQTPWATPLVYPQGAWLLGLCAFAFAGLVRAARATWLLVTGRMATLDRDFGPRTTKDELDEELQDLRERSVPEVAAPASHLAPQAHS